MNAARELSHFGLNLMGFNIFNYWARNADNFLIAKILGAPSLGIYSRAYTLMMIPITQLTGFVSQVMFPALSSIQNDRERIRRVYLRVTRLIAVVTCPIVMLLFVVAESFVHVIYGEKWGDAVPIFRILCITGILQGVGSTVGWIYTALGRTNLMLKWGIFSGTVYILSFCVGIRWGLLGIATAYVVSGYMILWYPSWEIPGRLINLSFVDMFKNVAGSLFCSLLMSFGIWLFSTMLPHALPEWLRLLIQILSGISIYIALINMFNLKAYQEIKSLRTSTHA
jgi:PST family polysaccharide transporter